MNSNKIAVGNPYFGASSSAAFSNQTINTSGTKVGWVFQAENANPITGAAIRYGARTGTPPMGIALIQGVEGVNGTPNGITLGGSTPASGNFYPPANTSWDGTIINIALANPYTPTLGQILSLVIAHGTGVVNASNNMSISYQDSANGSANTQQNMPYSLISTGSWGKNSFSPIYGIVTANETYGELYSNTYNTQQTVIGRRSACKFILYGSGTYQINGFRTAGLPGSVADSTTIFGIWDGNSIVQSGIWNTRLFGSNAHGWNTIYFSGVLQNLNFGSTYRIGYETRNTSNGIYIAGFQFGSGYSNFPGLTDWQLSVWNGTQWLDDAAVRPRIEIFLNDVSPSGGSTTIINSSSYPYITSLYNRGFN